MRSNFSLGTKKEWKEDQSPVTVTDTAINEFVIEAIREAYPDHAVIGEEESWGDPKAVDWVWVCDPVDGTIPFSHGYPTFAFSLGLAYKGESVLGVIYDPILDRLVVGRKGNGTSLNGESIRVGDYVGIQHGTFGLEGPNAVKLRTQIHDLHGHGPSLHSFVYEGMLVALGEFAGAIYAHEKPWDACALDIVIREAGGVATNLRGEPNAYNGYIDGFVCAASPGLHAQLLQLINQ